MSARRKLVGLALSFVAGTASACTVGAAIPVGQAEIYSAGPVVVPYSAPQTYYAGHPVYWYGDRWVYRDSGRWYAYRYEPQELYRYRTVRVAPPAYAPPPPAYAPPAYPPPAVHVH
jgi:hypothetical protein